MIQELFISTDTAAIAVFDLAAIRYRNSDARDWWSIVKDEVQEINDGSIAFWVWGETVVVG